MLKTGSEIARLKGVSKQAASNYILKNKIPAAGKKGKYPTYDCSEEPLASYLSAKAPRPQPEPPDIPEPSSQPPPESAEASALQIPKPLNDLASKILAPGNKPSTHFYYEAMKAAKENRDVSLFVKLAQIADKEDRDELYHRQMIKTEQAKEAMAQGKADRIQLENRIRREEYMDKATVKLIFGKQYAVDTSVLMPLGLKLADMINALPPGPERRAKIQKLIDDEVFSALETKKRLLADFLQSEAEPG